MLKSDIVKGSCIISDTRVQKKNMEVKAFGVLRMICVPNNA